MTRSPRKGYFGPEDKDGTASRSTSENGTRTDAAQEEARPTEEPVELDIVDPNFMAEAYDTYAELNSPAAGRRRRRATAPRRSSPSSSGARPSSSPTTTR
jgi:hypothetical protein